MTLLDFCRLLKQHLVWVIAVPVVCALIAAGVTVFAMPAQYSATATIRASAAVDIASLGGIVEAAAQKSASELGVEVVTKTDTTTRSVRVTAEGANANAVMATLNNVPSYVNEEAKNLFGEGVTISSSLPQNAENVSPSPVKYAAAALLAALFVVICIIVIVDRIKDPLRSVEDVEEMYDLEFLGSCMQGFDGYVNRHMSEPYDAKDARHGARGFSGDDQAQGNMSIKDEQHLAAGGFKNARALARETLLANVLFAGDDAQSFCIVPVSADDNAQLVLHELAHAAQVEGTAAEFRWAKPNGRVFDGFITETQARDSLAFIGTFSVEEGVGASYAAHEADATVLVLSVASTSHQALRDTLHQLNIAKAHVVGFVNAA